jgi:hypothetical protein
MDILKLWLDNLPYAIPFIILVIGAFAVDYEMRKSDHK